MGLQTIEYYKKKRRQRDKNNTKAVQTKRVEYLLILELKSLLEKHLETADKVMIEIKPNVLPQFLNILSDKALLGYDYEQADQNSFIFYNKEILL